MQQGRKPENYSFLLSPVLLTVPVHLVLRAHFCIHAGKAPLILVPELQDRATTEGKKKGGEGENQKTKKKKKTHNHTHKNNPHSFSLSPFKLQIYFAFSKNGKLTLSR